MFLFQKCFFIFKDILNAIFHSFFCFLNTEYHFEFITRLLYAAASNGDLCRIGEHNVPLIYE